MNVVFYNFTKRVNSTKEPMPSTGKSLNVQLKEETSFMNPVIRISKDVVAGAFSPAIYNYVQIPYWQRFYFINDWKYLNGVWECYCSVDPLASFKWEIGQTESYVVRSASEFDGTIIDTYYPATSDVDIEKAESIISPWADIAPSGGSYVCGVLNYQTGNNKVGACTYYALSITEFSNLMSYLFSDSIYWSEGIDEVSEGFFKSMFDPFQYIVSCMWFPFPPETFGNSSINIKVGYWDTGVKGITMTSLGRKTYITSYIPDHPQISRGSYLNHSPYTRVTLYLPPFGEIPIDTNFLSLGNRLESSVYIDHITGTATIRISISSKYTVDEFKVVTERSNQIGVPIQISQIMPDYVNTVSSAGNAITNLLTGNIVGALTGALSAVESQMPKVSSNGTNGSFLGTMMSPTLVTEHYRLAEENLSEYGRPLCKTRRLGELSGFIKCGEDDHEFPCTKAESEMINTYLKNGFFYE